MKRKFTVQCNAIRWEQGLRRCRLGQLNKAYRDEHDFSEQIYQKRVQNIYNIIFFFSNFIKMHILTYIKVTHSGMMQSDVNSFGGDVVLDSQNKEFTEED